MKRAKNKRLVTGIKPTGEIHIGNYFGMIKSLIELQNKYEAFVFIADYHALNQLQEAEKLSAYSLEVAKAYLAAGLDPKKAILFRQSDIPAVAELCWILNCFTPMGILKRAHAYKAAEQAGQSVNMGLFDYPVLMAADILVYQADIVPVGKDQLQHLEMTREIGQRVNNLCGPVFKMPQPFIDEKRQVINGLDGRKMSKSYNNTIALFASKEDIRKKVMSIVTDSSKVGQPRQPEKCNIFSFHKLFSQSQLAELEEKYKSGQMSCQASKEVLIENMNKFLEPLRKRKKELDKNPKYIRQILEQGRKKALAVAGETLAEVKKKLGLIN